MITRLTTPGNRIASRQQRRATSVSMKRVKVVMKT